MCARCSYVMQVKCDHDLVYVVNGLLCVPAAAAAAAVAAAAAIQGDQGERVLLGRTERQGS